MDIKCDYCVRGYQELLLEEIALEGLDGITLETLWARLLVNQEWIVNSFDGVVREFVWKHLLKLVNVRWYVLENPRQCPHIYSSLEDFLDGNQLDAEDIYKYHEVKSDADAGSCIDYETRKDVSGEVTNLDLNGAIEKWGNNLVIVASQQVRDYILFSGSHFSCNDVDITTYCILERIARGRFCGVFSTSLNFIKNGAKPSFYFWNKLRQKKFITCQSISWKHGNATLFLLKRFHRILGKNSTSNLVDVIKTIENSEKKYCLLTELKEINPRMGKLLKKQVYRDYLNVVKVSYSDLYPDSKTSEKNSTIGRKKLVTIVKISEKAEHVKSEIKEDESDDEDEDYNGILEESRLINKPLLSQCYHVVDEAGVDGISQSSVSTKLGLTKLHARLLLKVLLKIDLIVCAAPEYANKRFYNYYSKNYSYVKDSKIKEQLDKYQMLNASICEEQTDGTGDFTLDSESRKRKNKTQPETEETSSKKLKSSKKMQKSDQLETKGNDEEMKGEDGIVVGLKNVSIYLIRRLNIILEHVYKKEVELLMNLKTIIMEEEKRLGYSQGELDRKSLSSAVGILSSSRKVKVVKIAVKEPAFEKSRVITFVCRPHIDEDHPIIQEVVKQTKDSLSILYVKETSKNKKIAVSAQPLIHIDPRNTCYGFAPKFVRMKILHEMLSYLMFSYIGDETLDQDECRTFVKTVYKDLEDIENIPKCFVKELSWKMFIPPLMKYEEHPAGWVSQQDIVERFPLRLLFMIIRLPHQVPHFEEYIKHPIKQYYLVRDLPMEMQRAIRVDKKYLYWMNLTFRFLAMIGLVQFGEPRANIKGNMNLIYVNKKTQLLDTTSCPPAYSKIDRSIQYPIHRYSFNSLSDVEKYWSDAMRLCLHTKLGSKCGKSQEAKSIEKKKDRMPARLRSTFKQCSAMEAPLRDDGSVPGDRLGAVGFDSYLYSHLLRSWFFNRVRSSDESSKTSRLNSHTKHSKLVTQIANRRIVSKMRKFRYIIPPKCKVEKRTQKLSYDTNDIEALKNLKKMRVHWSDMEDNILVMCQLAASYCAKYSPNYRPSRTIRKLLHDTCPRAIDKTALACSRRIYRLMKSKIREHTVNVYLKELTQNAELKDECRPFVNALQKRAESKDSQNVIPIVDKMIEKVFKYVFARSAEAIEMTNKGKYGISLPSSVERFKHLYDYEYPNKEVDKSFALQTDNDVRIQVIINLIFSTLLSQVDKSKMLDMNYFTRVFNQFEDDELKMALSYVRENRLISFNKSCERFRSSYLPIGQGVYHLSLTIQLIWKSIYACELYGHIYKRYLDFQSCRCDDSLDIDSYDAGLSCLLVAYFILNKIKIDVRIPTKVLVFESKPLAIINPEEMVKPMFEAKNNYTERTRALIRETFFGGDEAASDYGDTNSNLIKINDYCSDSEPSEGEIELETTEENENKFSNITVSMTRVHFKQCELRYSNAYDHYLINLFPMKCNVERTSFSYGFNFPHSDNPYSRSRFEKEVVYHKFQYAQEQIKKTIENRLWKAEERDLAKSVLEFLHERGMYGATCETLRETFHNLQLLKTVTGILCQEKFVLRCGSKFTHYVHFDFMISWLLPCSSNVQLFVAKKDDEGPCIIKRNKENRKVTESRHNEEKIWVNMKPWIHSNGELNADALHSFLIRVLCYVVRYPGVTLFQVQKKFVPALQPHATRELLEILQNLGCVKWQLFARGFVDLFSSSSVSDSTLDVTGFEDENTLILDPDVNAIVKLSTCIGSPTYNDLLDKKYSDLGNSEQLSESVDNQELDEVENSEQHIK